MKRLKPGWPLAFFGLLCGCVASGQESGPDFIDPVRGYQPVATYSLDGIEAINQSNGNVLFHIPLANLYTGPGDFPLKSLDLYYNSAIYTTTTHTLNVWTTTGGTPVDTPYTYYQVSLSPDGGWHYGTGYWLEELERPFSDSGAVSGAPPTQWCTDHIEQWRILVVLPDGSKHELRPSGYSQYESADGYFQITPNPGDQNIPSGCGGSVVTLPSSLTYYSIDGSYLRLVVQTGSSWQYDWTLYFPDGSNVQSSQTLGGEKITDRNGNTVTITGMTGLFGGTTTTLMDQFGRSITLTYAAGGQADDEISAEGGDAAATVLTTYVHWHAITPPSYQYSCGPSITNCTGNLNLTGRTGVDSIQLPSQDGNVYTNNGTAIPLSYTFAYNTETINNGQQYGFGEINSLTLPSLASQYYSFANDGHSPTAQGLSENTPISKSVVYNAEYDGTVTPQTDVWSYSFTPTSSTITAPDGGQTINTFYWLYGTPPIAFQGMIYHTQNPDYSMVDTVWQQNIPQIDGPRLGDTLNAYRAYMITSIPPSGSGTPIIAKGDLYTYDKNGNVTLDQEYDWQPYSSVQFPGGSGTPASGISGTPTRNRSTTPCVQTPIASDDTTGSVYSYYSGTSPAVLNAICSVDTTYAGAEASRTEYGYDGNYNLKTETRWDSTKGAYSNPLTGSNSIAVSHTYGTNGTLTSTTDAVGTLTQYTYGSINGYSNLCPTQTIVGYGMSQLQRTTSFAPNYYTCLSTNTTDVENGIVTATAYDAFGRTISRTEAQGRQEARTTTVTYQDGCDNSNNTSCRYAFVKSDLTSGDEALPFVYRYDQLGRIRLKQQLEAPSTSVPAESAGIKIQTRYVYTGGQYRLVSNPFRASTSSGATSETTMGWTLTAYDTMNRVSAVRSFGSASAPAWTQTTGGSGSTTTLYSASTTLAGRNGALATVTDEAGKTKTTVSDGLGRLAGVVEDPNGLDYLTTYGYDGLDDLTSVSQSGLSRAFSFDSLGRLSKAINPESGTVCYGTLSTSGTCTVSGGYDGNGNPLKKSFLKSGSSSPFTVTTETLDYDYLNRVVRKTYTDGTPTVLMCYDGNGSATPSDGTGTVTCSGAPALSGVNARGRLTWATNANSTTSYSNFDSFGRVLQNSQITNSATYPFSYSYNEVGLTAEVYPSQRSVTFGYDGAGRVSSIAGTTTYTPATILYAAQNAITSLPLKNGLTEQTCYNSRLQTFAIRLGNGTTTNCGEGTTADSLNLVLTYGATQDGTGNVTSNDDNGNILTQQIARSGQTTLTQSYNPTTSPYDGVNRITSASESGGICEWSQTYGHDPYGNHWVSSPSNCGFTLSSLTPIASTNFTAGTNQLNVQGSTFDDAGNLAAIGGWTYAYDAESRLTSSTMNSSTTTYAYDGEGRRVQKVSSTGVTTYVYDAMGALIAEYSTVPSTPLCTTCYLTADHLRSTRLETDSSGAMVACHDYLPFGEEIPIGTGSRSGSCFAGTDTTTLKFTGKERDAETGLDYFGARYFSGGQGRFTSPDPENRGGKVPDPQSWNMYAYGRNNPLLYTDPTGETYQICVTNDDGKNQCSNVSDEQFADLQKNPGNGISLSNGQINAFVDGQWVKAGTYEQTDVDLPPGVGMALNAAGNTAAAEINRFARDVAIGVGTGLVAGVVIGAAAEGVEALPRVLPFKNTDLIQRVSRALTRIAQGAKMYSRDGIPFQNREGLLPSQGPGYYTEYTVEPASGGAGRGAERLVLGKGGEVYYTPNHYGSFVRIQ